MAMYKFRDFQSKEVVSTDSLVFTGKGRPWEVCMDLSLVKEKLNLDFFKKSSPITSKYLPLLPLKDYRNYISMGEGETPLIRSRILEYEFSAKLFFKLEGQNPTGSFKDRGSALELSVAREYGAKGIVLASTGNMAASCACYSAAARIPCFVVVPEGTPQSKLAQVIAYGGRIVQVKGSYGDAARLAEVIAHEYGFYLAGDYAFRAEGGKTAAYELIEQMHYQIPDIVVVPIGCGTNLASYFKGFSDFLELGLIDKMPQLIGVQAEAANPVVRAFKEGKKTFEPLSEVRSLAGAIAINDPLDGIKALDALYNSSGLAIDLSEEEMVSAQYELSKEEGIFVETSCAAGFAALRKLILSNPLKDKTIVCILTGTGLKDPKPILSASLQAVSISPDITEFRELYEKELRFTQRLHFLGDLKAPFKEGVTIDEVDKHIKENLKINLEKDSLIKVYDSINSYLSRGISVLLSDLKYIIEEVRVEEDLSNPAFKVVSYSIEANSNQKVSTKIKVRFSDNKEYDYQSEGIGLINSVFEAFLNVIPDRIVSLEDFRVDVTKVDPQGFVGVYVEIFSSGARYSARASSHDLASGILKSFTRVFNKILAA